MSKAPKPPKVDKVHELALKIGKVMGNSKTSASEDLSALVACMWACIKASAGRKDLEVARNTLDEIKSSILNQLSADGWE